MRIIGRSEWGARPARGRLTMSLPTSRLWLHHTATDGWHGPSGVRACQAFHMDTRRYEDIAYSFLIDDDGTVYEGRGAGVIGGHTKGDNSKSHAICAMGDFDKRAPTPQMLHGIVSLIAYGRGRGWWHGLTGGHRDAPGASTACPGAHLYRLVPQIKGSVPTQQEDDDLTPDEKRMLQEVWDALVGNRRARHKDDRSHDLATPILDTNHVVVNELDRK